MLLTELSKIIECIKIYNFCKKNINFNYVFTNSKNIKNFSILAIQDNKKFKKKHIQEAVENGAIAILTNKYIKDISIPQFKVQNVNLSVYKILNKLKPKRPLNSIAITGTNGKTSVLWYISQICFLNKLSTKTFGTLGHYVDNKKIFNSILTTPEYDILHQNSFSKKQNNFNFIFEASSHSLDQNRLKNFPINVAAITNITQDHLDYHKTFTNYKNAKLKLFTNHLNLNGYAVINDKINGITNFKKKILNKNIIITYGLKTSDVHFFEERKKIKIKIFKKIYTLKLKKYSLFELENISCAIACCLCLNLNAKNIIKSLESITNPPGRIEEIKNNKNFRIYVDYAHTPDALKRVLINYTSGKKKPSVVFGCGGNRDQNKRLKMGEIANQFANKVYITDDNPRNENPSKIRQSILTKCKKGIEIPDREKAILKAIKDLSKNDILIIAGKGHEKIQIIKNSFKFFDDVKIVKNALKNKKK